MTSTAKTLQLHRLMTALGTCVVLAHASVGSAQLQKAQPAPEPPPQQPQPQAQPQPQPQPQPAQPQAESGGSAIQVEEHMGQRPQPPENDVIDRKDEDLTLATGAGVGSSLAYASESVVELGGTMAITHASKTTTVRFSPLIGYFFVDNFELTLFPDLMLVDVGDQSDVSVGGVLEASYHAPLEDNLLVFGGLGVGVKYAEDPGVDLFFRPRLGFDLLVGRSGILKPALFMDVGVNDGLTSGGLEASFTVML